MDIFNAFATDEKAELEGRWFPLSKTASIKVARAGNPAYVKELRKQIDEKQLNVDLDNQSDEDNELATAAIIEVTAKTILLDFKGLSYKGKPVEYSTAMAKTFLEIKDFRKKVDRLSADAANFRLKEEAEVGNG